LGHPRRNYCHCRKLARALHQARAAPVVVIQLLGVAHKAGRKELLYWGVLVGLVAGFLTDMVVTAGGA
jgi:hypothetical protein